MNPIPKSRRADYVRPIRLKTQVIFVYADPKNKEFLEKNLRYMSASAWVNNLLGLIRQEHEEFKGMLEVVERQPYKKNGGNRKKVAT